jgi:hypothetical protein
MDLLEEFEKNKKTLLNSCLISLWKYLVNKTHWIRKKTYGKKKYLSFSKFLDIIIGYLSKFLKFSQIT